MSLNFPYLNYYLPALTKYKVHSPFVFDFINDVFEDERYYHFFGVIENYRRNLLATGDKIKINNQLQSINQLVNSREIDPKTGEILFKAIHLYKPKTLLEIGTNLGISTLYQATPNPHVPLISLESAPELSRQTKAYFQKLGTRNITCIAGPISTNLPSVINTLKSLEFIFFNKPIDEKAAISYFEQCLPHLTPNSMVVVRNPYASLGSALFWDYLKKQAITKLSIDIYDLGFIFFRPEQKAIAHYKLIESWKKPWAIF